MKILHTADWHLGTFRSPVKDGVNLRTEDTKRCLDELIRVANEEKPDYSLVSGDIFHCKIKKLQLKRNAERNLPPRKWPRQKKRWKRYLAEMMG